MIAIVLSMILVGENWWARYVPQFYFLLIGSIILMVYCFKYTNRKVYNFFTIIVILILLLNIRYFLNNNYNLIKSFDTINSELKELQTMESVNLKLTTESLYGYLYNLNDKNIKYNLVKSIDSKKLRYMYSWRLEVEQK